MNLSKILLVAYSLSVITVVAGALVARFVNVETGVILASIGATFGGKLMSQPSFAKRELVVDTNEDPTPVSNPTRLPPPST